MPSTTSLPELLLAIRRGQLPPPTSVDGALVPDTEADAYAVQDTVGRSLGPVGGWKVGASSPDAEPACAPIHTTTIFGDGDTVPANTCHHLGVEAEIGYRFARTLPPRATPWTRDEVLDAIGTAHPVIEILDTRFARPGSLHKLLHAADQQSHGALIVGPGTSAWRTLDPIHERVVLRIDGKVVKDHIGGNSAGDPLRMLVWLANHAARRGMGIDAGCVVTTGSTTGTIFVAHGTDVEASFPALGSVRAYLA
ncbi:2-oxopent-4-enoate hydratase [Komagataeibacter diospyri]|uniref:2-keto-4-pentenoate hydratase n=1 Tax=Komagataeibacter diospyri TaxID=1932662 RepID=UPI00113D8280|nr:fumarylacetoacetate hydrolase family protein [Komagataeibacter diospyri]GCE88671.1 2-oxopent-4-enoate hydratase [Komagataeibacter diospyri]